MEFKTPVGTPRSPGAGVAWLMSHMTKQLHLQRNVTKPASILQRVTIKGTKGG